MFPGTGPGRGVPWWRRALLGLIVRESHGALGPEQPGRPREGRTVAKVPPR